MHERDSDRSLANGRRHTLDVAAADVTDREHAGPTCFEEIGRPGKGPAGGSQIVVRQIRAGLDEPFRVEYDTTPKPARAGNGTGHDEDVLDVVGLDAPGFIVPPAHALEVVTPVLRQNIVRLSDSLGGIRDRPPRR